jgi:hypothetical protein
LVTEKVSPVAALLHAPLMKFFEGVGFILFLSMGSL